MMLRLEREGIRAEALMWALPILEKLLERTVRGMMSELEAKVRLSCSECSSYRPIVRWWRRDPEMEAPRMVRELRRQLEAHQRKEHPKPGEKRVSKATMAKREKALRRTEQRISADLRRRIEQEAR